MADYNGIPDLLSRWSCDDNAASTVVTDSVGLHNGVSRKAAGADNNTDQITAVGVLGGSFNFDGATEYFDVADHADYDITTALTVSCWAKNNAASIAAIEVLFAKSADGLNEVEWILSVDTSNRLLGRISSDGTSPGGANVSLKRSVESVVLNQWNHYAMTFEPSNHVVYINGVKISQTQISVEQATIFNAASPLSIGAETDVYFVNSTRLHWDGSIDEVLIFDRTLTESEIMEVFGESSDRVRSRFGRIIGRSSF